MLHRITGDRDASTAEHHRSSRRRAGRLLSSTLQSKEKLLNGKTRRPAIITACVPDEEIKAKSGVCVDNKGLLSGLRKASTERAQRHSRAAPN